MQKTTLARLLCGLTLVGALGACGGNMDGTGGAAGTSTNAAGGTDNGKGNGGTPPGQQVANRALVIELDGVTYAALAAGIAGGTLPNLAKLHIAPAYSGGVNGLLSQQPNLDTPGWATLLTGAWGNRHQVLSDAPNQALQAPTAFDTLKTANAGLLGAAVGSPALAALLTAGRNAGNLDTLANCAAVDSCVTQQSTTMIQQGYSLVVAQYHSAQDAALNYGLGAAAYANTLKQLDASVGALVAETAKRNKENWLVVVTGGHGLNAAGGSDGLPLLSESTTFIAMNQADNGRLGSAAQPASLADLHARASIADIAPTVLAQFGTLPASSAYEMDGGELIGAQPVSQLAGTASTDGHSVVLTWAAPASGAIAVYRAGQQIATLPAGTTTYTDSNLGLTAAGTYSFDYVVTAGGAPLGSIVRIAYVPPPPPPPPLAATLKNGLASYYPFGALPAVDALNASTMGPFPAAANGGSLVADPFGGQALQVTTQTVDTNGYDGYKLVQNADIATQAQFTIGMWLKTPCTDVVGFGTPVFANKNWQSGKNAGIAIGLFPQASGAPSGTCNLQYNAGDGTNRNDLKTMSVTANQWVYAAFVIDTVGKTMTAYTFDPVLGEQKQSTPLTVSVAALPGLGTKTFGVNEDGTGQYHMLACGYPASHYSGGYTVNACTTVKPNVESFSDVAMWNRVVTEAELQSVAGSGKPLSTILH
ncbi:LamG domain-containing protein [Burkholderia arboris]|uniref:LamG domain-containing protein n=1 Tax=Burkholderia arboris TaxID=488730 RepID=A0ABZ3DVT3_9BURK